MLSVQFTKPLVVIQVMTHVKRGDLAADCFKEIGENRQRKKYRKQQELPAVFHF